MKRIGWPALVGIAVISACVSAFAANVTVAQKDVEFQPSRISIRVGDTVTFVNQDRFGHNVFSVTTGGEFDIGLQAAGQQNAVTFRRAGTFEVLCHIHPKMRLEIVVAP